MAPIKRCSFSTWESGFPARNVPCKQAANPAREASIVREEFEPATRYFSESLSKETIPIGKSLSSTTGKTLTE